MLGRSRLFQAIHDWFSMGTDGAAAEDPTSRRRSGIGSRLAQVLPVPPHYGLWGLGFEFGPLYASCVDDEDEDEQQELDQHE